MAVTLTGTTGNDTLFGSTAQAAYVQAKEGNDRLVSQYTNTTLLGNAGNDSLTIEQGDGSVVTINPGQGNDTVSISGLATLGTLYVANGLGTSVNYGNDTFNFNTAGGTPTLSGTVRGGEGDDTIVMADGIDGNGFKYNAGQGTDQTNVSANSAVTFRNSQFRAGQGNDSSVFEFNSGLILNGLTIAGGQGQDTINFGANSGLNASGSIQILGGADADVISANLAPDTGFISGNFQIVGGAGADTITTTVVGAATGAFDLRVYGDDASISGTGTDADTILVNYSHSGLLQDTTGLIAGGGGNDTITVSANSTAGSAGWSLDGGLGNDSITITDGYNYAGTINGGDGADKITFNMGTGMTATNGQSGNLGATLMGGAGNDTFSNTTVDTAVNASGWAMTGLIVAIQDFATGDLIELLGVQSVNEDANIARSAFLTRTFETNSGAGLTGAAATNNIAMYRDGDDVVLTIAQGTATADNVFSEGSNIGLAVIRFVDNSAFATQVDAASGALSNVSINLTQSLTGLKISFT